MINLLPPQAKRTVTREYWFRVLGVWALLGVVVMLIGVALLLPTYVFLVQQLDAVALEVVQTENANSTAYTEAQEELARANVLAAQLSVESTYPAAAVTLDEIESVQPTGIDLESFSYTFVESGEGVVVVLEGRADVRTTVVSFVDALKRSPLFVHAEVPVGNLAQDRDLPFTITIDVARSDT